MSEPGAQKSSGNPRSESSGPAASGTEKEDKAKPENEVQIEVRARACPAFSLQIVCAKPPLTPRFPRIPAPQEVLRDHWALLHSSEKEEVLQLTLAQVLDKGGIIADDPRGVQAVRMMLENPELMTLVRFAFVTAATTGQGRLPAELWQTGLTRDILTVFTDNLRQSRALRVVQDTVFSAAVLHLFAWSTLRWWLAWPLLAVVCVAQRYASSFTALGYPLAGVFLPPPGGLLMRWATRLVGGGAAAEAGAGAGEGREREGGLLSRLGDADDPDRPVARVLAFAEAFLVLYAGLWPRAEWAAVALAAGVYVAALLERPVGVSRGPAAQDGVKATRIVLGWLLDAVFLVACGMTGLVPLCAALIYRYPALLVAASGVVAIAVGGMALLQAAWTSATPPLLALLVNLVCVVLWFKWATWSPLACVPDTGADGAIAAAARAFMLSKEGALAHGASVSSALELAESASVLAAEAFARAACEARWFRAWLDWVLLVLVTCTAVPPLSRVAIEALAPIVHPRTPEESGGGGRGVDVDAARIARTVREALITIVATVSLMGVGLLVGLASVLRVGPLLSKAVGLAFVGVGLAGGAVVVAAVVAKRLIAGAAMREGGVGAAAEAAATGAAGAGEGGGASSSASAAAAAATAAAAAAAAGAGAGAGPMALDEEVRWALGRAGRWLATVKDAFASADASTRAEQAEEGSKGEGKEEEAAEGAGKGRAEGEGEGKGEGKRDGKRGQGQGKGKGKAGHEKPD